MLFIACGLNHKTAPLDLREKMASMHDSLLASLMALEGTREAIVLSTCNRTEFYCYTEDPEAIIPWFTQKYQHASDILPHIYQYTGEEAKRHVLRVACGLDSMMLGEPQILGQIKQAWQNACILGTARHQLKNLFEFIFSATKRIRNQSGIGHNPISVAYASVQLISHHFNSLDSLCVFLAGSGDIATLVAKYLHKKGVRQFLVASRTRESAMSLASIFEGVALTTSDIPAFLPKADIVVTATSCPLPFISRNMVELALKQRNNKSMLFLDLAVPRDIEPEVELIEGVHLYNIDHLKNRADKGLKERESAAEKAELFIDLEMQKLQNLDQARKASHLISDYRELMKHLAAQELNRALRKLECGASQENVMTEFSRRLVQKLTHLPSTGLRQVAEEGQEELLKLAQYIFNTSLSRHTDEKIP